MLVLFIPIVLHVVAPFKAECTTKFLNEVVIFMY